MSYPRPACEIKVSDTFSASPADHLRQRPPASPMDFREFIRLSGMTRVETSPYYPQSNGKVERCHKTIKGGCIRVRTPLSLEDAIAVVDEFVGHYNTRRLHSAIGYITPKDKLEGRAEAILAARDAKLAAAREARKALRKAS